MKRIEIQTGSRLHFGLFSWGSDHARQFGGVGLMVREPGVALEATASSRFAAFGPLSGRAGQIAQAIAAGMTKRGLTPLPCAIRIRKTPQEHRGLGVGTQLSLAIARAMLELANASDCSPELLAQLTGRGERSGIGLHGFTHGGLLVDGGRNPKAIIPPLVSRLSFPDEWSIVLVTPNGPPGLHGDPERTAFDQLPPIQPSQTDRLCRLTLLELLPAVLERDLPTFGSALSAIQKIVGQAFAPAQGGVYQSSTANTIAEHMEHLGLYGVGQSSWGPTIYGFSDRNPYELAASLTSLHRLFQLDPAAVLTTHALNSPAAVRSTG